MAIGRETTIGIGAAALGVACMAVDHLVGTEPEPGEDDSFPVDPAAFALGSPATIMNCLGTILFGDLPRDFPGHIKGLPCGFAAYCSSIDVIMTRSSCSICTKRSRS